MAEAEQSATEPGADWLTRAEVRRLLGISKTSVARHLASTLDADGKRLISPEEVARYAEANGISLRAPDNANAATSNADVAAAVYAEFEGGHTDSAIVRKLILEPKVVKALREQWNAGNGLETLSGMEIVRSLKAENQSFRKDIATNLGVIMALGRHVTKMEEKLGLHIE